MKLMRAMLGLAIIVAGCGKSEDAGGPATGENIVGHWKVVPPEGAKEGGPGLGDMLASMQCELRADKQVFFKNPAMGAQGGTWSLDGDTLTMNFTDELAVKTQKYKATEKQIKKLDSEIEMTYHKLKES